MDNEALKVLCALAGEHDWITFHEADEDLIVTHCINCGEKSNIEPRDEG